MTRGRLIAFAIITSCALSVALLWRAHGAPLLWDEVDYVAAARLGFVANYLDNGSLTPRQFVEFAKAKSDGRPAPYPADYSESTDPFLLRHFHPPLTSYLLIPVAHSSSERVTRAMQLIGALILLTLLFVGYLAIANSPTLAGLSTVGVLGVWLSLITFDAINMHGWAAISILALALALQRWLLKPNWLTALAICGCLALVILTLETGIVLSAAAVLVMFLDRRQSISVTLLRILAASAFVAGLVVVIWPGSILKITMVKTVLVYLYRFKLGTEYAGVASYFPFVELMPASILLIACAWLVLKQRADIRSWGPFLLVGAVYGLFMMRFALRAEYLAPGLAPFICLAGLFADRLRRPALSWALAGACAAMVVIVPRRDIAEGADSFRADVEWLGQVIAGRAAFVDGAHIFLHYLGPHHKMKPLTIQVDMSITTRDGPMYRKLGGSDFAGKLVVVQNVRKGFFGGSSERTLIDRCARTIRSRLTVYDCT